MLLSCHFRPEIEKEELSIYNSASFKTFDCVFTAALAQRRKKKDAVVVVKRVNFVSHLFWLKAFSRQPIVKASLISKRVFIKN